MPLNWTCGECGAFNPPRWDECWRCGMHLAAEVSSAAPVEAACVGCGQLTLLSCSQCGQPLCSVCGERLSVGSYCAGCIVQRRKAFDRKFYSSGRAVDYPIAFAVSCGLAAVCMLLGVNLAYFLRRAGVNFALREASLSLLGQWWAGVIVSAVYRRRSRYLKHVALLGMFIGIQLGGYVASCLLDLNPLSGIFWGVFIAALTGRALYREIM